MFSLLKKKLADWIKKPKAEEKPEEEKYLKAGQEKESVKEPAKMFDRNIKARKSKKLAGEIKDELEESLEEQPSLGYPQAEESGKIRETKSTEKTQQPFQAEEKKGLFSRLKEVFLSKKITEEFFEESFQELEIILLESNVAVSVVDSIKEILKSKLVGKEFRKNEAENIIKRALRETLSELLIESDKDIIGYIKNSPSTVVILFCGINGSGKTTTLAKIACLLKRNNISCVFAASDTFRAASIEQLAAHGRNLGISIVKQTYGSDPAAVAFDAIQYAKAKKIKAVLIDTAGRMHTKQNLMEEMSKIVRVAKPDFKLFIGESITGNDMISQCKKFDEAINIDGMILTKSDIDEKGGAILSASHAIKKPILYLGVGQEYSDLERFDKKKVIERLGL